MSVSEGNGRSIGAFFRERVKSDLQFSNIFLVDFTASMGYALVTLVFLAREDLSTRWAHPVLFLMLAYAALHVGKIALIVYLEKRGGDARQFVGSEQLVTSGFYQWSRNPVYLISLIQSAAWSTSLLLMGAGSPDFWLALIAAPALLYGHYWGQDRLIIPNEEAALLKRHPDAFPAYCARVNRWFGRKG